MNASDTGAAIASPQGRPLRILLVEDDEDDFILARDWLSRGGRIRFDLTWAASLAEALQALEVQPPDVLLVDYDLGTHTGLDFVRAVAERGCRAPIIMLSGRGNYTVDVQAMNAGVADYLAKSEVTPQLLERSIRYALDRQATIRALQEAKEALEARVQERTRELQQKNEALEIEIAQRMRIEGDLADVRRRLLDRAERERLELARDLHDGPMQDLYSIRFQLKTFSNKLERPELREEAFTFQRKVQEVLQSLRAMAGELRPPALAPFGLEKAIRSHAETHAWTYPGMQVHLELMPDGQQLHEAMRMSLFRIYQVALTNVIRHSSASQVFIRLHLDRDSIVLEVEDNGKGFQVPERLFDLAGSGHLGLVGAAERAEALGGWLEIQSHPGKGSRVRVVVPCCG
jgi:signal transduction histidine kinase